MPKHLMIAVDWFGPYHSMEEAHQAAKPYDWPGLYVCTGKSAGSSLAKLQYIGISNSLSRRLTPAHHKLGLGKLTDIQDTQLWLGEVVTAEPSGKKLKVTRATLDLAEWLHARFLELPLNDRKTKTLPERSVTVLNRWWSADFQSLRRNRPHPDWPNLIDFPRNDAHARAVWFGGKQRVFAPPDYLPPK